MRISKEAKVGFLAIIAGVTLYFGFDYLNGIDFFKDIKRYYVIYSNVGGLNISNQIMLDGVSVGRVSDITINQKEKHVAVELEVNGNIVIGRGSDARLHGDLLGTKSIILVIDQIEDPLQDGDTLGGTLEKALEDIIKESTQPVAADLQTVMAKINAILDNFQGSGDMTKDALVNLNEMLRVTRITISENRAQLNETLVSMNELLQGLKTTNEAIPATLAKFGQAADSIKSIKINETLAQTEKTLKEMELLMMTLNSGEGTLPRLMKEDTLYNNLNSSLHSLDTLLQHMNANPKHFFGPLGKSRKKIEKDLRKQSEN